MVKGIYSEVSAVLSGLDLVDGHLSNPPPERIVLREFQTMIVRRDRAVYVPHKDGRWVIAHPNLNAQIGQHAGYLARGKDCFQDHPDANGPS